MKKISYIISVLLLVFTVFSGCKPDYAYDDDPHWGFAKLKITDENGEPLRGMTIGSIAYIDGKAYPHVKKVSDQDGIVCFGKLGPCDYAFYHDSEALMIKPDTLYATISPDKNHYFDFALKMELMQPTRGNVILTVIDNATDIPRTGLYISLYQIVGSGKKLITELKSDINGEIKFFNLQPGAYQISPRNSGDYYDMTVVPGVNEWQHRYIEKIATMVDRSGWSVIGFSSQQETNANNYFAHFLIDGDPAKYWNSRWSPTPAAEYPHYFVIDMGGNVTFAGVAMQNRTTGSGETFKDFTIELSSDNVSWSTPEAYVHTYNSTNTTVELIPFEAPKTARYIKVTATTSHASGKGTNLGEFWVYKY